MSTYATSNNSHTMLIPKSSQCEHSQKAGVHPHVKNNIATRVFKTQRLSCAVTESPSFLLPSSAISAQEGLIRHMLTHKTLECGVKFKYTETFDFFFLVKCLFARSSYIHHTHVSFPTNIQSLGQTCVFLAQCEQGQWPPCAFSGWYLPETEVRGGGGVTR